MGIEHERIASLATVAVIWHEHITSHHCPRPQVFDLSRNKPGVVLQQLWSNFDQQVAAGDPEAELIRRRTRVLVAGGDGTIAWCVYSQGCLGWL